MKRVRRGVVAMASVLWLVTMASSGSSAQTLPSQASPVADEHTHGPDGLELDRRGWPVVAASFGVDSHAYWESGDYDGQAFPADQPDLTPGLPMFHAIYVYPSDKPSRFGTYAAMFQADARAASGLLGGLYNRAIRMDERQAASGSHLLDITVHRSRYNSKQLAGSRQFNLVNDELAVKFSASNKKYMVWLDADSKYCGQGHLSQNTVRSAANPNEGRTLAMVYRPYSASVDDGTTGGFCRGRTLLHELGHTMGALQKVAPHAYDGAHCDDSGEDTMCYTSPSSVDTGRPDFDYKNDDYWDPVANPSYSTDYPDGPGGTLSWWTVNLSSFLCDAPTSCDVASTPKY